MIMSALDSTVTQQIPIGYCLTLKKCYMTRRYSSSPTLKHTRSPEMRSMQKLPVKCLHMC